MKKGQTQTIFIWIFIAIVAGLILIFGFKMIKNISETGEDVAVVNFFQKFEKRVNEFYYLDEGSQGSGEFSLPSWVEYVCVRKSGNYPFSDQKSLTLISSENFEERNVFLIPIKDSSLHMKRVKNLEGSDGGCFEVVNGRIKIVFINDGGKVNFG